VNEGFVTPEAALHNYGVRVIESAPDEFVLADPPRRAKEA
jgi:hypothetical protein